MDVVGEQVPPSQRFGGDCPFVHPVEAKLVQTGAGDRHLIEGAKLGSVLEVAPKGQASLTKEPHVGGTVSQEVSFYVEIHAVGHLVVVPPVELDLVSSRHGVGSVLGFGSISITHISFRGIE